MTKSASTRSPCWLNGSCRYPPEKVWRALTQGPLIEE